MGFSHHKSGPPPPAQIALRFPRLSDRDVGGTLRLADGYEALRSALLALSGLSLVHSLGLGTPASLGGVVPSVEAMLEDSRCALATPIGSRHAGLKARAAVMLAGVEILEEEAHALRTGARTEISSRALQSVRDLLSRISLPDAGMRHFGSASCAAYSAVHEHFGSTHHHGIDGPSHDHNQGSREQLTHVARRREIE